VKASSCVGEQLELPFPRTHAKGLLEPWEGQSPRVLTKSYKKFSL